MTEPTEAAKRKQEAALVRLLVILTIVTGTVDAVSILRLGRVFVANMTGNVVFLGFAVAGAPGFSVAASLVAVGAFLAGAAIGGRIFDLPANQKLARMATAEALLCAAATVVAVTAHGTAARYSMSVLLALAMGGQNATVRKLAVPDMTTTVLTLTLTGLAADRPDFSAPVSHSRRRVASVAAMLVGAVAGALLVLHASTGWALGTATVLLFGVAAAAQRADRPTH
jgi:uncharacterized membrane protein YoaK (UPF0700 family)